MAEEHLTEELLERLRASARPEAYLDEGLTIDRKLSDYLYELRIEKGLKRSTIIKACGINQTRHQLLLSVEVQAGAILSRYQVQVDAPTEYVLAETILVGETPQNYTQVLTDSKELLGDINDYKASDSLEISANP